MRRTLALSINTSWNLVNFRSNLIRRFQAEDFEVVALSPEDRHVDTLKTMGVRHIPITIDSKGLSPLADLSLAAHYWQILRKMRPVAYLGWTAKPNIYGSIAANACGIPVINNVSGLGTAFITRSPVTHIVRALYRTAFHRSDAVFFQNNHDRDFFISQRVVAEDRSSVLPGSGIDLDQFNPGENIGADVAPPVFLMVARLLRDKGVNEFADAARIVRRQRPDVQFHLLGFLDAPNRTAISREAVKAWEREGVLQYLGETDDVRPHLIAATAVVLPSYREGLPRSLLEGAAMGRPLIATDVPGCSAIARQDENAELCAARDANSLAVAMLRMLDKSPTERADMGRASRRIAKGEFDVGIIEEAYLRAIFNSIQ